ncbi:hypothetical protein EZS27_038250, partial [termite gut metagenome]
KLFTGNYYHDCQIYVLKYKDKVFINYDSSK